MAEAVPSLTAGGGGPVKLPSATTGLTTNIAMFSPIIITFSILMFSVFISQIQKGLFYIFLIIVITSARSAAFSYMPKFNPSSAANNSANKMVPPICSVGGFLPGSQNESYSTYVLMFTLAYICGPMIVNANINYGVLLFLIIYSIFDIMNRMKLGCITSTFGLMGDLIMGLILGSSIAALMYSFGGKKLLFVNDISSNKEVCSMPSKQTFKCAVYKNGELVESATTN